MTFSKVEINIIGSGNDCGRMQLKEYIEKYRIDPDDLMKKCKISRSSFYNYVNGRQIPHFKTAIRIEEFTKKNVTVEELRGSTDGTTKRSNS